MKTARLVAIVACAALSPALSSNAEPFFVTAPTATKSSPTSPDELVALGIRYEHAEGMPRDYDRALALFCEAAAKGSGTGAYNLAIMRLNGRGIERSDANAVYWLELARARGHHHAA